jgi:hypothetical protein
MENIYLDSNVQYRYTPDKDTVPKGTVVHCGVCKAPMTESRDHRGPRSSAEAMAKKGSAYDSFTCPKAKESWHRQVVALRKELQKAVSKKIRIILAEEIEQIFQTEAATLPEPDLNSALSWAGHHELVQFESKNV